MIKYKLICKSCSNSFDSWFASSLEFDKLKKKKLLNCIKCNSKKVEKTLMAPKLINKSKFDNSDKKILRIKRLNDKIKKYQKFIKNNFENVGENFAYEARSIFYDNKKRNKGIYGTASDEEMNELKEEGIDAEMVPWIDDKKN